MPTSPRSPPCLIALSTRLEIASNRTVAIADHAHDRAGIELEPNTLLFGCGFEQFCDFADDRAQIGVTEVRGAVACFDLRDPKQ